MNMFSIRALIPFGFFFHSLLVSCGSGADTHGVDSERDSADAQQGNPDAGPQGGWDPHTAPTVDCDNLPALPVPFTAIEGITCSEDFTFDNEGYLISVELSDQSIYRIEKGKTRELLYLNVSKYARGIRVLPNNDIVFSDSVQNSVKRIEPSGDLTNLSSSINGPNGITVAPNGHLYVTGMYSNGVFDIDPETGTTVQAGSIPDILANITFSQDYKKLFVAGMFNRIYEFPVLENGGLGQYADFITMKDAPGGMVVDECGNLYSSLGNGPLVRIGSDGTIETVTDYGGQLGFPQNVNFGSGKFGWDEHKLYVTMSVISACIIFEIDVGVGAKRGPQ